MPDVITDLLLINAAPASAGVLMQVAARAVGRCRLDLDLDPPDQTLGLQPELLEVALGHRDPGSLVPEDDSWEGVDVEPDLEAEVLVEVDLGEDDVDPCLLDLDGGLDVAVGEPVAAGAVVLEELDQNSRIGPDGAVNRRLVELNH